MLKFILGNPYLFGGIAAVILALGAWGFVEHRLRVAAYDDRDAFARQAAMSLDDANRWQEASGQRDQAIDALQAQLARQSAEIEKARADASRLADIAKANAEARRQDRDAFDARIRDLQEQAHAHPDQVVPLGPIVRARVDSLFN